jgi:hypothetical protein
VSAYAGAAVLLAAYLAQHVTAPPNSSEGGTMLGYVHAIARGARVHFDFFDYYGPLGWALPSAFYGAAGETVVGVRIYMLLLKLTSVALTYAFVGRLCGRRLAAGLATLLTAALVGQSWPAFQIPYAGHLAYPVVLGAWLLLLVPGDRRPRHWMVAGTVTAAIVWIKVTEGAFVLAGGLFHLLYFRRFPGDGEASRSAAARRRLALWLLVVYWAVFHVFVAAHFGWAYFIYLSLPLLIALGWARRGILDEPERLRPALSAATTYGVSACVAWVIIGSVTFGPVELWRYIVGQATTLVRLEHAVPFPTLGHYGTLGNFTRFCFPLLPILVTIVFTRRWILYRERARLDAPDAISAGVFAMTTFHTFVIYARSDEVHLRISSPA